MGGRGDKEYMPHLTLYQCLHFSNKCFSFTVLFIKSINKRAINFTINENLKNANSPKNSKTFGMFPLLLGLSFFLCIFLVSVT
jgi:hypothetical protein